MRTTATDPLTAYARLWALQQCLTCGLFKMLASAVGGQSDGLILSNVKLTLKVFSPPIQAMYVISVLWLLVAPRASLLLLLHAAHMYLHITRLPEIWNSEWWDGLIEVAVLLTGIAGLLLLPPTSDDAHFSRWLALRAAPAAQVCFIILYTLTALYKFTSTFLDPARSCAPLFLMALFESVWPSSIADPPTALLGFIVSISPAATVFVEALIPIVLYLSPWPFGFAIGVLFHFLIAVTPPPNNAGGFSVGVLTRYFFFAPEQCARAFDVRPPPSFAAASAATMAFVVVLGSRRNGDWGCVVATAMSILHLHAMLVSRGPHQEGGDALAPGQQTDSPRVTRALSLVMVTTVGLTLAYGMGPVLGLQDMGATTMFANLHVYGRSNHVLGLPTGLLFPRSSQTTLEPRVSWAPSSVLAGGTVRVDYTTARHFNDIHPHEITSLHAPRLRRWLRAGGHSGRQFGAYVARVMHIKAPPAEHQGLLAHFVPYMIPFVEFRRLILEATSSGGDAAGVEPFLVDYTRVDVQAATPLYRARVKFDARGKGRCVKGGAGCEADLRLLTTPLPGWAMRFLLFFSFPVEEGESTFRELSCTC